MRLVLVALALVACKSEEGSDVTLQRSDREAPAVVEVEGSAQIDLAAAREAEPNDTRDKATPLKLPVAVSGTLASEKDVDLYTLEVPRSGDLAFAIDELDLDVAVELLDAGGEKLAASDRGPARTTEGIPNYPVNKGDKLYVAVKEFVDPKRKKRKKDKEGDDGKRPPYRLEVRMLEGSADELEREPNSEADDARTVLLGDRPSGYLGWSGDVDLWKLSLQGFGENNLIDLSIEGIDGIALQLVLTDARGEKVLERTGRKSGALYVRGLSGIDSPHLLARISGDRSHPTQRYRLQFATRHRDEGAEVEPNDTGTTATELAGEASGGGSGHLTDEDVDYFTIEPTAEPVSVTIGVEGPAGVTFALEAWAGGKSIGSTKGRGKVELFGLPLTANQRVRFRVKTEGVTGDPARYSITWIQAGPAPAPDVPVDEGEGDPGDELE